MRAASVWLGQRLQLGQDLWARGQPEDMVETDRSRLALDVPGLLRAYLGAIRRGGTRQRYRPQPLTVWTVKDALTRLARLLGSIPDWSSLEAFLPDNMASPTERRAALASTLIASLEMARDGALRLRQDAAFGPILLRSHTETPDTAQVANDA